MNELLSIDADLLLAVNGWRSTGADTFMWVFSGKFIWIPLYVSLAFVIWRSVGWRMALGCLVTVALTITLADQTAGSLLRPIFQRLRPSNLQNPLSEFVQVVHDYRGGSYGFPSCHAANTFGLAFFLFYTLRHRRLTIFIFLWAGLTCYSRAYLGVHYPGDLVAGAVVGFLSATICYSLLRLILHYHPACQVRFSWLPIAVGAATTLGILIYAFLPS